jgi:hypothetical protein
MPFMASATVSKSLKVRVLLLAVHHQPPKCTITHQETSEFERKIKKKSEQAARQLLVVSVQITL